MISLLVVLARAGKTGDWAPRFSCFQEFEEEVTKPLYLNKEFMNGAAFAAYFF